MNYNANFKKLDGEYIFSKIRNIASSLPSEKGKIIDLGIGDVKLPLFKKTVDAMKSACDEMGDIKTFKGYSPINGYPFLRDKISHEYQLIGADISSDEIFITDGAKGQLGIITEIFDKNIKTLFVTPCYTAGAEANILKGNDVDYLIASCQENFIAYPPLNKRYNLIYLCSPCNPTGAVMSKKDLAIWIEYALSTNAIIIFDNAYSCFATGDFPKSIYQIKGADTCAIEINSFSKSLGFTGIRCGYTIVPKKIEGANALFNRLLGCSFNGVSYISQRGAETFFDREIKSQLEKRINFYKTNAEILKIALKFSNLWYNSSVCTPYVFAKTPKNLSSQEFCQKLLDELGIIATPASGFLKGGEGYFRLSAFCKREDALLASDRLKRLAHFY